MLLNAPVYNGDALIAEVITGAANIPRRLVDQIDNGELSFVLESAFQEIMDAYTRRVLHHDDPPFGPGQQDLTTAMVRLFNDHLYQFLPLPIGLSGDTDPPPTITVNIVGSNMPGSVIGDGPMRVVTWRYGSRVGFPVHCLGHRERKWWSVGNTTMEDLLFAQLFFVWDKYFLPAIVRWRQVVEPAHIFGLTKVVEMVRVFGTIHSYPGRRACSKYLAYLVINIQEELERRVQTRTERLVADFISILQCISLGQGPPTEQDACFSECRTAIVSLFASTSPFIPRVFEREFESKLVTLLLCECRLQYRIWDSLRRHLGEEYLGPRGYESNRKNQESLLSAVSIWQRHRENEYQATRLVSGWHHFPVGHLDN